MILDYLYNLIIMPLIYIYEVVFTSCYESLVRFIPNIADKYVISILAVSIVVNILSYPLFDAAYKMQQKTNEIQNRLNVVANHINNVFSGDERFMITNAYYRLENYNPINGIKSILPLLLQIPFFTAAYYFFINVKCFHGLHFATFPLITDLSKPDAMVAVNGIVINVLPFVMTIINIISSLIYTSTLDFKSKVQSIVLALIFLILLYNSPSCLLIYWIFNNVFSLIKSIILVIIENKKKHIILSPSNKPLVGNATIYMSLASLTMILGILIPSLAIKSSPAEFIVGDKLPYYIILYCVNIVLGLAIWMLVQYFLLEANGRVLLSHITFFVCIYLLVNFYCFANHNSFINELFTFMNGYIPFGLKDLLKDLILFVFIFVLCIISLRFCNYVKKFSIILFISLVLFSTLNIYSINIQLIKYQKTHDKNLDADLDLKKAKLSKNGKNVIVLMLDRAIGDCFRFVIHEKPELKHIYDGFTFYDNALSSSHNTLCGAPGLFGGYDYITQNLNARNDVLLADKNNEALSIMPYNFSKNGFNIFVYNLPNENYSILDKSSYLDSIDNLYRVDFAREFYDKELLKMTNDNVINLTKRNALMYSFMMTAPVVFKGVIYNNGYYLTQKINGYSYATINNYNRLYNLVYENEIIDDDSDNFWMIDNELMHNHTSTLLPRTYYAPAPNVSDEDFDYPYLYDDSGNVFSGDVAHFSTEVSAYLTVGKFLEYLKENQIYDNTRIIIVSDHGFKKISESNNPTVRIKKDSNSFTLDITNYNCVFFYKDFNSHGELKVSHDFMMNADTPYYAMKGIINNPINPYLNKVINEDMKLSIDGIDLYSGSKDWNAADYRNDYVFTNYIATFKGSDIFDNENWSYIEGK